jgi:hypothetical protein
MWGKRRVVLWLLLLGLALVLTGGRRAGPSVTIADLGLDWTCNTHIPSLTDPAGVWSPDFASTIVSGWCSCTDGAGAATCGNLANMTFEDGATNAMTGTVTCTQKGTPPTKQTISGTNTLAAQEIMLANAVGVVDVGDVYIVCWEFTVP